MKRLSYGLLFLLAAGLLGGCGDDGDDAKLSTIQTDIFDKSCSFSSCHGAGATSPELTSGKSHGNLVDRASNIEAGKKLVVAGKPDESLLYLVLQGSVGAVNQMPKGSKLDAAKVEAVRKWIADGAQNN